MLGLELPNFKSAAMVAVFGGISAFVIAWVSGWITGLGDGIVAGLGGILVTLVLLTAFLTLLKQTKEKFNVVSFVILLAGVSIFSGLIKIFVPQIDFLVLSVDNVFSSVNALLYVLTSITLGGFVSQMFGLE